MRKSLALILAPCFATLSLTAVAKTPTFSELFEDQGRVRNVPVSFAADIGTVFVTADESEIDRDVSCDSLSEFALYVESQENRPPFEIQFQHDHPGYEGEIGDLTLDERETFTLKLGVEEIDIWGAQVGFASQLGDQYLPVRFGPAAPGQPDAELYGELYIDGEPTGIRYANIFQSVCSGADRMDGQVLVTFEMLGEDLQYFITLQSNAPFPQRQTFGPYAIPESVLSEGYGACMVRGRSGVGRMLADGATCLASSKHELLPINHDRRTHRDTNRR